MTTEAQQPDKHTAHELRLERVQHEHTKAKLKATEEAYEMLLKRESQQPVDMSGRPINYSSPAMPNGEFVGEVYYLTHDVIKHIGATVSNEQFIAAETALRDFIWKSCQRAACNPERESVIGELVEMNFEADQPEITFQVPRDSRWFAGKYAITAIESPHP